MSALREDQLQVIELRNELNKLRSVEQSSKLTASRVEELEAVVQRLTAELASERKEKEQIVADRENVCRDKDEVSVFVTCVDLGTNCRLSRDRGLHVKYSKRS